MLNTSNIQQVSNYIACINFYSEMIAQTLGIEVTDNAANDDKVIGYITKRFEKTNSEKFYIPVDMLAKAIGITVIDTLSVLDRWGFGFEFERGIFID